jgi:MFS superfamily sulfate permease-like transporter
LVLLDLEATSELDVSSADMLAELESELRAAGSSLALARVRTKVRAMLTRTSVLTAIGEEHLYPSVMDGAEDFAAHPSSVSTT